MSQQINLYDPALLRKRELLTAVNLAAAAGALLLLLGVWGALARAHLGTLEGESEKLAPQVKALQDRMIAMGKQLAELKPNPQLEAELASARDLLVLRSALVTVLKKGVGDEAVGFSEYLRGFARQTPSGLWLAGFAISDSGTTMEIRGRMTDPALLPEYIHRLDGEPAFKGHTFAALKIAAGKLEAPDQAPPAAPTPTPPAAPSPGSPATPATPIPAPAATPVPAAAARTPFLEFTLTSVPMAQAPGASGAASDGGRGLTEGRQ